ncbi:MAG: hypothetical protein JZD41_04715 [Thermoproteus sp.]|nr:hypothetical protein [Thermoproteus sp.]
MGELNEQLGKTRRKSREEIRREIMEFIRRNNIADPDILAVLAEELGYRARRTRWTIRGR